MKKVRKNLKYQKIDIKNIKMSQMLKKANLEVKDIQIKKTMMLKQKLMLQDLQEKMQNLLQKLSRQKVYIIKVQQKKRLYI